MEPNKELTDEELKKAFEESVEKDEDAAVVEDFPEEEEEKK